MVTANFARAAWPDQHPIGRRVHLGVPEGPLIEIVGVVEDSLQRALDRGRAPQFFERMSADAAFPPSRVLVRTAVPPESIASAVRTAVRRVDPLQPVARLRTLDDVVGASTAGRRFDLALLASFALMALVSVLGALVTVLARSPIRSAVGLLTAIVGIAGLFLKLNAQFLSAIQLIVYDKNGQASSAVTHTLVVQ